MLCLEIICFGVPQRQNLHIYTTTECGNCYALLVICNHGPPSPGGLRGIDVEMSGSLTNVFPRQCGGNTQGLLYVDSKGREMKR